MTNTNSTAANKTIIIRDLKVSDQLAAIVSVLRSCQRTQVPVRLRMDGKDGAVASGRIKAVHRHNGMEFLTTDVPVNEKLSNEAIWMLDIRDVYSVEVLGLPSRPVERKERTNGGSGATNAGTPGPRAHAGTRANRSTGRAKAEAKV